MDRLRKEDGRHPFVLAPAQIAELNRRASNCRHPLTQLLAIATLVPCPAPVLAAVGVRDLDRREGLLAIAAPNGGRTRIALGHAAEAAVRNAIAGRARGLLFGDVHDAPIVPDADAVAYANELMEEDGEGPLQFSWTFRSVREGVFAAMAHDDEQQEVAEAQAGLRRLTDGHDVETKMRIKERALSDWWSAQLVVPTIDLARAGRRYLNRSDGPGGASDRGGDAA